MLRIQRCRRRTRFLAAILLAPILVAAGPAKVGVAAWRLPVDPAHGAVERGYDPPLLRWSAGHRGVDLAASRGTKVHAAMAGMVTYAGTLAGRGVVVVNHGRLRSTYEPVNPAVVVGARVNAGDVLGALTLESSHCAPKACLHWGVKEGHEYRDPLALIATGRSEVRLLPLGERALTGDPPAASRSSEFGVPAAAPGRFRLPVPSPYVTSPYGMRRHPVTGIVKLHDGTDFHAPCSSPVRAAASGIISRAGPAGAYGSQVVIEHGLRDGQSVATSYSHLSQLNVAPGQHVTVGQIIGLAGTTGLSTGCHLHFMVHSGGAPVDPMPWLSR